MLGIVGLRMSRPTCIDDLVPDNDNIQAMLFIYLHCALHDKQV